MEGPGAHATHARLRESDLAADLAQREAAPEREHEDAALELWQAAQLTHDLRPSLVGRPAATFGVDRGGRRERGVPARGKPIEGDLEVRRWHVLGPSLRVPVCATSGPRERVALAQRVEHLSAHPQRGVGAERGADLAAVPLRRLHQAEHAPGDEVVPIGPAAPGIERPGGDRSGEAEVRDDALVARRISHLSTVPRPRTLGGRRKGVNSPLTELSTDPEAVFSRYAYPEWLKTHSRLVGRIALLLVGAHRERGADLDAATVVLGAYFHDIGRSPLLRGDVREHNELGALVLAAEGLAGYSELARRHPVYAVLDPATAPRTLAEKIVYYADRRGGMSLVSLEERNREVARRHPRYAAEIARSLEPARAIEREVFAGLPFGPDELAEHMR